jgi:DNA repair protein RadC
LEHNNFPITNWSEDDKPREKPMLKGVALSDAELIAIWFRAGNESAVLSKRI